MNKEKLKETANVIKNGLVMFLKLLLLIITSFLKAITVNFFQNVKAGWGNALKKPEVKKAEKGAVKEEKPVKKK
ncbi:MAG: hypothetical protein PHO02_06555 [Candidatus Nanoarchaeia archaeon]|nr:hypothetical protein [Candidatus Nanoarchaeia archaeon]